MHSLCIELPLHYSLIMQNFVSECIGIGYVGITVIVWSIFSFTNNIVLGQITPFISRTAPALLVSLIYITMCLFLVFWKRQPSFVVVFIATASFGVADSFWMLAPLSEYNLAHLSYLGMYISTYIDEMC